MRIEKYISPQSVSLMVKICYRWRLEEYLD